MDTAQQRREMVRFQVEDRGVRDPRVLAALEAVPRERFVPPALAELAYDDRPLPIGLGQTISQPYIVAFMLEQLRLMPADTLLEVGCGSGYAAAVASRICARVYAIERHPELAAAAAERLAELGYANVTVLDGDGTLGLPRAAPFDAVLVSAGGSTVPEPLLEQLADGGRLVIPIGSEPGRQQLLRITRSGDDFTRERLGHVAFVPLVGEGQGPEG